ncbi:hypothetical protein [Piscinibacterium candidicorallinum]|jgi:hypothetical protein|uniref:Uncharacterized protein n=1 Tax=Piscinibacterium candidicorallinum TaxID=1793872 RepID=A0ABV7H2E6_9BURK
MARQKEDFRLLCFYTVFAQKPILAMFLRRCDEVISDKKPALTGGLKRAGGAIRVQRNVWVVRIAQCSSLPKRSAETFSPMQKARRLAGFS